MARPTQRARARIALADRRRGDDEWRRWYKCTVHSTRASSRAEAARSVCAPHCDEKRGPSTKSSFSALAARGRHRPAGIPCLLSHSLSLVAFQLAIDVDLGVLDQRGWGAADSVSDKERERERALDGLIYCVQ